MKISRKILLSFILVWATLFSAIYFTSRHSHAILEKDFLASAPEDAEHRVARFDDFTRQEKSELDFFFFSLVGLGLLGFTLFAVLLHQLIFKRIKKFNNQIIDITHEGQFFKRIDLGGRDELSAMAKEVNALLEVIEISQKQLELHIQSHILALHKATDDLRQEMTGREKPEKKPGVQEKTLETQSHYDESTHLPNTTLFHQHLQELITQGDRDHHKIIVCVFGVDQFDEIHSAFKQTYDEEIMRALAERFSQQLEKDVFIARLNESEFGLCMRRSDNIKELESIAQGWLQIIAEPLSIKKQEFYLTVSIGFCLFPEDGALPETLEKNARSAMYRAKSEGGNRLKRYSREMSLRALQRVKLERRLRRAIANRDFVMFYQPKYHLKTHKIMGIEALIRWQDAEQGMVPPNDFIPLAEETNLILPLGVWALRDVCDTAKICQEAGLLHFPIAINLSPVQFSSADLVPTLSRILKEVGLPPQFLEVEITESTMVKDTAEARKKLEELNAMGVHVSVDDFGTGYSSMTYLKQFPIKTLKVDRSFVEDLPENQDSRAIVNAVIALAHTLGLKVVAEGIETIQQLDYLRAQGCDGGQGYLFSRPVNKEKMIELLRKGEF